MRHHEDDADSLEQSVDKLNKALEAGQYNGPSPVLQVEDVSAIANKYLHSGARYDMSQKATSQIVRTDEGRVFQAIYFSCIVKTGNEEAGVRALADIINDLSQQGLIHSCLAPISSLHLAITSSVKKSAVFVFPVVPQECVKDCQAKYKEFFTLEGGIGQELEDTSVPLAEGEFLAEIVLSHHSAMIRSEGSLEQRVQREIDEYLKVLPEGTEVVQKTELAIYDLSYRVEVKFRHPRMYDVSKVELDHVRCIRPLEEGKLEQYNRFTGIRYFGKDGKPLYEYR